MSGSLINEDSLVKLAGVIRQKNGTSTSYRPNQMAAAILALNTDTTTPVDSVSVDILDDVLVTLDDSTREIIRSIGVYCFYNSTTVTGINLPKCTSIGAYAFYNCVNLANISFPACTSIGDYAFYNCTGIVSLGDGVRIGSIGNSGFRGCSGLASFKSTSGGTINSSAFANCSSLETLDFGAYCNLYDCVRGCTSLQSITLRAANKSVIQGNASTYFQDTLIPTTGHIYVPAEWIDIYLEDPYWATLGSRFAEIPSDIPEQDGGGE